MIFTIITYVVVFGFGFAFGSMYWHTKHIRDVVFFEKLKREFREQLDQFQGGERAKEQ